MKRRSGWEMMLLSLLLSSDGGEVEMGKIGRWMEGEEGCCSIE